MKNEGGYPRFHGDLRDSISMAPALTRIKRSKTAQQADTITPQRMDAGRSTNRKESKRLLRRRSARRREAEGFCDGLPSGVCSSRRWLSPSPHTSTVSPRSTSLLRTMRLGVFQPPHVHFGNGWCHERQRDERHGQPSRHRRSPFQGVTGIRFRAPVLSPNQPGRS